MIEIILIGVVLTVCSWIFYKIGYCNGHKAGRVTMIKFYEKMKGE